MRRYAKRRDESERLVIEALEAVGARVLPLNDDIRAGVPDLLVYFRAKLYLLEVKAPLGPAGGTSKSGQQLSRAQMRFHAEWAGVCDTVRSPLEALLAIHAISPNELHRGRVDSVSVDP